MHPRTRRRAGLFILPLLLAWVPARTCHGEELEALLERVDEGRIRAHVAFLADDRLGGRLAATAGEAAAARYIASRFEESGLTPLSSGGFIVPFPLLDLLVVRRTQAIVELHGRPSPPLPAFRDWTPLDASGTGDVDGEAVFCGFGLAREGYDDLAGLSLEGRVALVFPGKPAWWDGVAPSVAARVLRLQERGATAALVFATGERPPRSLRVLSRTEYRRLGLASGFVSLFRDRIARLLGTFKIGALEPRVILASHPSLLRAATGRFGEGEEGDSGPWSIRKRIRIPCLRIGERFARALLAGDGGGEGMAHRRRVLEETHRPASRVLAGVRVRVRVEATRHRRMSRIVVGRLAATRPSREALVVGAHFDHLGTLPRPRAGSWSRREDFIWNGADDNASGTASLLELARLAGRAERRRDLIFIAFGAEEYGLVGSRQYVREPLFPLSRTVGMLNLDMVGRNPEEALWVTGAGSGRGLEQLFRDANGDLEHPLRLWLNDIFVGNSDQLSFLRRGIPSLFLTTGLHRDYHEASDELSRLSTRRVAEVTRFALATLLRWANREQRVPFEETYRRSLR